MTGFANIFGVLRRLRFQRKRAIILGAGSVEYNLFRRLEREREYNVLFFIDDEPWNHRTKIGRAELRYPSELAALCENHRIDAVFYCDAAKAQELPTLNCEVIKHDA